jgi:hypothetical protein
MTSPTLASSSPARGDAAAALTPSEELLLAAATTPPPTESEPWLRTPENAQVAEALAAAFLANEQAGLVALESGSRKRWFGLKSVAALYARPTGRGGATWPAGSLEARVLEAAAALAPKGKHHVGAVAEACIPYDSAPEWEVTARAWAALQTRALVGTVTEERKTLGVFKSKRTHEALTPAGAALVARAGTGAARTLIDGCVRARPHLWATLTTETRTAFARMTRDQTSSDSGDWGGSD